MLISPWRFSLTSSTIRMRGLGAAGISVSVMVAVRGSGPVGKLGAKVRQGGEGLVDGEVIHLPGEGADGRLQGAAGDAAAQLRQEALGGAEIVVEGGVEQVEAAHQLGGQQRRRGARGADAGPRQAVDV